MKCPFCHHEESKVVDKRESEEGMAERRRRECLKCCKRYTTYERIEDLQLFVIKKDGRRECFSREKLKNGIIRACEKRDVSNEKIDEIVEFIEGKLRGYKESEVKTNVIGNLVMGKLKSLDKVAYIRFASVYKEFNDIEELKEEVKKL